MARPRPAAALLVLGALAVAARAAPPVPKGDWNEITTEHFTIFSNASRGKTEDIAVEIDLLRQVLERLGAEPSSAGGRPLTIVIFRNESAFAPYMRSPPVKGTVRSWEGYFGVERDYLLLNGSRPTADLLPWAYSAYASHFLSQRHPGLPYWLRSGLSSFYSTAQIDRKGSVRLGYPDQQDLRTLRERSILPLGQFFQVTRSSGLFGNRQGIALFGAQAWLVTHYVSTGGGAGPQLGAQFFSLIGNGMSEEEAIRQAFGMDLDRFESALRGYVNSPTMPVFGLKNQQFEVIEVPLAEMSTEEVAYQLGFYLATAHTPPPSGLTEEHLLPLTESGDRAGDALATLGELRRRSGRPDDATAFFERALEVGPSDAASYYFAAVHLQALDATSNRSKIREALGRVIELDPAFGEAYVRLDRTYPPDESEVAIPNLEKAVELLADQPVAAYNLVVRYLNVGDVDSARRTVDRRLASADAAEYRERALRQIESRAAAIERKRWLDAYNLAIDLYNQRRFEESRAAVEPVLEAADPQLRQRAQELLEAIAKVEDRDAGG